MIQRFQDATANLMGGAGVMTTLALFSRLYLGLSYVVASAATAVLNQMLMSYSQRGPACSARSQR